MVVGWGATVRLAYSALRDFPEASDTFSSPIVIKQKGMCAVLLTTNPF